MSAVPTPTGIETTNALPYSYPYPLVNQPTAHKKSKRFSLKTKAPEPPSQEASVGWQKNIDLHEYSKTTGELQKTSNYPLFLSTSSASLSYIEYFTLEMNSCTCINLIVTCYLN